MIIAVDFDGVLVEDRGFGKLGEMGEPNIELFIELKYRQLHGDKLILWTCREGKLLEDAVKFCKRHGLEFNAVNDNIQPNNFQWQPRKIYADLYIDDKALKVLFKDGEFNWHTHNFRQHLSERGLV